MDTLTKLGTDMLGWFSTFWTWLSETRIGDLVGIAEWLPDIIEDLPLITVILGGVLTLYCTWVLVSWVIDVLP